MVDTRTLHESFNLYITADAYTFEPTDAHGNADAEGKSLIVNRSTGGITLHEYNIMSPPVADRATTVYGIMGILSLSTTDFLILITGRTAARGRMNGHVVYLATDFRVLPIAPPSPNSLLAHPVEKHLIALVQKHLSTSVFWFSYGWDLTRNLQAQATNADPSKPLWELADDRFFWNKYMHSRFIDITTSDPTQDLSRYILPVVYGSFEIRQTHIGRIPFNFVLISRRSRYRAGTRYFTRGIDSQGHVANYNETEQIIFIDEDGSEKDSQSRVGFGGLSEVEGSTRMSFVQTRGSVPVYWAEINNLRYKPDLQVMDMPDTTQALNLHLHEQLRLYGAQTLVNLVKDKGHEKPIKEAYERRLAELKLDGVHYEYFNFAAECKNMRFDKINILIDRMQPTLMSNGWFHQSANSSTLIKQQSGVVRTNCMDCLDRTNVVQSALGKWVLSQQLRSIGVLSEKESVDEHEDFMEVFRNVWADHADYVSNAYSGTGALKTDFTRTGTRTKQGLLQDGQNSIVRYLKNNYFDGDRQDAFDLFTGAWVPRRGPASALSLVIDSRPLATRSMPYTLLFSLFMIVAGLSLPRASNYSLYYYNIFWLILAAISFTYILGHGVEYVAWPRLNPPIDIIFYDGPGFKSGERGKGFSSDLIPWKLLPKGVASKVAPYLTVSGLGGLHRPTRVKTDEIEMGLRKRVD